MDYFLTIAASDNSGGAGIQQDLKVAHALGYWGLSALTGITVQNFEQLTAMQTVDADLLGKQIESCFRSFPVKTVKIGAICSTENISVIAHYLKKFQPQTVVLDTVLASTRGASLLEDNATSVLQEELFACTTLTTPNKHEFEKLTDIEINSMDEAIEIAKQKCSEWNTSILLKGGHFSGKTIREALVTKENVFRFERERESFSAYSHGTGCTLSSAMACYLGQNHSLIESYHAASDFLLKMYQSMQSHVF